MDHRRQGREHRLRTVATELVSSRPGRVLLVALLLVLGAGVLVQIAKYGFGHGRLLGLRSVFDLAGEHNVPTFFNALLLLGCSGVLGLIAHSTSAGRGDYVGHWIALSLLFLYLSIDEAAELHEKTIEPVRDALGLGGLLYFAWVLPGLALVAAVGLGSMRFLKSLPLETRRSFLGAAALYVGSAVGIEMVEAMYFEDRGIDGVYHLFVTFEEAGEMLALIVFGTALRSYYRRRERKGYGVSRLRRSEPARVAG